MHQSAMFYGRRFFEVYCPVSLGEDFTVVEIGSQNVNGSLREVCPPDVKYIGIDFVEGDGVDVVITDPYQLPLPDISADMVVSSSCFEHSEFFWLVFLEAMRILKPAGVFYLNAPTNGLFHQWPVDSWRFYPDSGHALVGWAKRNGYDAMLLESFVGQRSDGSVSEGGMWNDFVAVFLKGRHHRDKYPARIVHSLVNFSNGYSSEHPGILNHNEKGPDFSLIDELMKELEARARDIESLSKTVAERDTQIARLCELVGERERQIAKKKDEAIHLEPQKHCRVVPVAMIEANQSIRQALIAANKTTDAVFALEKLIESYPEYAAGHNDLGFLYNETGNPRKALFAYQKAVFLDPGNVTFRKTLADFLHVVMKQPEEAMRHYEKVLERHPRDTETLLILGNLQIGFRRFRTAKNCFLRVLEIDPSNEMAEKMFDAIDSKEQDCPRIEPEFLLREARSLAYRDQTERAITKLERLLQVDPHNAIANNDLGFLHYQKGEKEKARLFYEKAVAADGTNVTALKNLADFYFEESGETERSLQLYTMVLQMQPRDLEALKGIGLICLKLEQYQDATEIFQKIQAIDPNDTEIPQVLDSLGRFLASQPASSPTISYPTISSQSLQSSTAENLNSQDMKLDWNNRAKENAKIDKNNLESLIRSFSPKVSIVIPVYNKLQFTRKCIEFTLKNTNSVLYEIIIVDNGSTDGTTTYLQSLPYPFKVIYNNSNLGFAQACNQGIRAATAPYILFLNNDTEPLPGWLEPLVEILDNDLSVAAVGSKLLFPDRTIQHAGVIIALQEASGQICPFHIFYKEKGSLAAANRVMDFAVCTGACLMVRAERLRELGGFDENFWNGYEDVDLCLRLCQGGGRVVYQPKSVLIHYESQSGPERFSRQNQNIELLQRKWRNKVPADIIIKPDGKIIHQKSTRIRPYSEDRKSIKDNHAPESQSEKHRLLSCTPGITSIVILTFNQLEFTKKCIESIQKHTAIPHEIIFIDNGSSDGTVKWLRKIIKWKSNYKLIENKQNLGFSKGCNQGIAASRVNTSCF